MPMIIAEDLALGILLGVSLSLTAFFYAFYRRSGASGLRPMIIGLSSHSSLTVVLLLSSVETAWFDELDQWVIPASDVLVLAIVVVVGMLLGRAHERPT